MTSLPLFWSVIVEFVVTDSVPGRLLQVYDWCCQSSAAPLCKSQSAHRATTPSHQVRSTGVVCCRPDSLELAVRLFPWSVHQRIHF